MVDFNSKDVISLHSDSNVRVCISFQVLDYKDNFRSDMFTRVFSLVPGEDVRISLYNNFLEIK